MVLMATSLSLEVVMERREGEQENGTMLARR